MHVIILGGNSLANHEWVLQVAQRLKTDGHDSYPHVYRHWQAGQGFIDITHELRALQISGQLQGEYQIIAKSMGSVMALQGMATGVLRPESCVFLGFPLKVVQQETLPVSSWLTDLQRPAIFVQNDRDPVGSYQAVRKYLERAGVASRAILEWSCDTHNYLDLDAIATLSSSLAATPEHH